MNMIFDEEQFGRITSPRTQKFLAAAAARSKTDVHSPKEADWTHAYFERFAGEPLRRRQALALAWALENEPLCFFDDELLFGHINQTVPGSGSCDLHGGGPWTEIGAANCIRRRCHDEIPALDALTAPENPGGYGGSWIACLNFSPGHIGWHWDWIVAEGVTGMFRRLEAASEQADADGRAVLEGMRIMLTAMLTWNDRHVQELKRQAALASGARRDDLQAKIAVGERVPRLGARTFREAVQAFHFSYLATMFENPYGGNGPGRLDYYLWPYLERDLAAGTETPESARELIDELFIRIHERLRFGSDGHVETIVVGGCDGDGRPAVSRLTGIMVESIAALKLSHPSVYIRIPEEAPESLWRLAASDICGGGNRAQIVGDREIIAAMTRDGHLTEADARMYMCGGCMEISPHGMNGDLLFTGFFNVFKVLEYVLTGGRCLISGRHTFTHLTASLAGYASFEELYTAFADELKRTLELTFRAMDIAAQEFAARRPRFLASSQIDDCIARGRCINEGGARYEDFGSTPLGIPNAADSLTAIRQAVFVDKFISGAELLAAMSNNFADNEPLRRKLQQLPKFGQGCAEADAMVGRLIGTVTAIYDAYRNCLGGVIKPMIMTFSMAPVTGAAVGASADGRRSGVTIAQGISPQSSSMRDGIGTAMRSVNTLPLRRFAGGASSMWDLDPDMAKNPVVMPLLQTFFSLGGQMFQGNTTGIDELCVAQRQPEQYPHLLVRVGGYSGRFTALSRELQDEVISRYRHRR